MLRLQVTVGGGQEIVEVRGERFVIGREVGEVDLPLDDEEVSRRHAALRELPDGRLEIEDLGSRNGTSVDGQRISGPVTLSGGEQLKLGATLIAVEQPRAADTLQTPGGPAPTIATGPPATVVGQPPPNVAPTTPLPPSATPTVAVPKPQPPAMPKQPRRARLSLIIAAVLFALLGAAAIAFVVLDDDDAWDSAFAEERQQACESTGAGADECGCFIDELEAEFTQEEYEQVVADVDAGVQNEAVDRRAEIAGDCGVDLG
jgi:hypothetical protein